MYQFTQSRELMLQKDLSRSFDHGCSRVLWGKVCKLYRVYKLIMVSHVPCYGHLEYLELDIIVDLITLKLIELGLMMILVLLGLSWRNLLKYC